jgi:hypothetical protein
MESKTNTSGGVSSVSSGSSGSSISSISSASSAPVQNEPSEEVKKLAFEKVAQIKIYQLFLLAEVINLASSRGAFRGAELSHVGALFDTLSSGVDKAFQLAKEDLGKVGNEKAEAATATPSLPTISENDSQ